jgi:Chitobiase/beta-hexosaminidase C-terminal domain
LADIKKIYLGPNALKAVYHAADKVFDFTADTTAPTTTPRPVAGAYTGTQTVYLDVNEPCDTYYTTNGDTPTIGGATTTHYTGAITISATTTLKYFSVDTSGNVEAVKSATYTITPASTKPSYRYLRILGYGSAAANDVTTRIIEFEAFSGGVNRMTNATMLSSDTINNTGTLAQIKDGVKTTTSNSYPLWWTSPVPNAHVVIDLGAQYTFDSMNYYSYSVSGDQRANRFMIQGSNTNNGTDWATVWDMSTNTTVQPILPSGFSITFS